MVRDLTDVSEENWRAAERLASFLDMILQTAPKSAERAQAVEELALRLRRTPQTIRAYLRKYQAERRVSSLLRDDSGRGPRLKSDQESIIRGVIKD